MSLEINENEISENEVTPQKINKKLLAVLLIVLFLVMLSSGFFVYKLVLANSLDAEKSVTKVGPIYETEEFVVNFSGSVNRYIKAQFALELSNKKVKKELEEKKALLYDAVILILSEQKGEVLSSKGKEVLKNSLIQSINKFLDKGSVEKIHYLIFQLT
ncbi:MAG: flagellar basal body-associated FliL family protein [Peptococcia bacterium]